ncbi:MAG: Flp pilus assembly protein CpaB [Polyangiales bacterium]
MNTFSSKSSEPRPSGIELGSKSRRALLIAAILGLAGAALLMLYLRHFEEEVSGGGRVPLLTVLRPVARGALITADLLTVSLVPRAYVEQRAVRLSDRDRVVGVRTVNALSAQDFLLWSDLALSTENRDVSSLVQPGKRAVTVRASESGSDPAGNGLVRPGDYVDVIVTVHGEMPSGSAAVVLLQRVLVLAVGSQTEPYGASDGRFDRRTVERELTLSLKLEEAQLLSLARERGVLSVALRAPNDAKVIENIADVPVSSLYDKTARENTQRRGTPAAPGLASSSLPVRVQSER